MSCVSLLEDVGKSEAIKARESDEKDILGTDGCTEGWKDENVNEYKADKVEADETSMKTTTSALSTELQQL